jgi:hypothetical protein
MAEKESNIKSPEKLAESFGRKKREKSDAATPGQMSKVRGPMDGSRPAPPNVGIDAREEKMVPPAADQQAMPPAAAVPQEVAPMDVNTLNNRLDSIEMRISETQTEVENVRSTALRAEADARTNEQAIGDLDDNLSNSRGTDDDITVTRDAQGNLVIDSDKADPYPFEVIRDPDDYDNIAIRGGLVDIITFPSGAMDVTSHQITAGTFTGGGSLPSEIWTNTGSLSASQTRWVYLAITGAAGLGHMSEAQSVSAYISADATRPEEDALSYQPMTIKVLAKVVTDSDTNVTITQEWTGGNIKLWAPIPDYVDGSKSSPTSSSIWFDPDARLSLYNFAGQLDGKVLYAINATNNMTLGYDYASKAGSSENGTMTNIVRDMASDGTQQYITFNLTAYECGTGATPAREPGFSNIRDTGSGTSIDIWSMMDAYASSATPFTHPHKNHTFALDDHDGSAAGDGAYAGALSAPRYIMTEGNASRNNFLAGSMLGDSANADSLSPNLRTLYGKWHSNETDASDTVIADNSFYSLGGIGVTNGIYSTQGTGNQAGKFSNAFFTAILCDANFGAKWTDIASNVVEIFDGTDVLTATDGARTAVLADGTYAVNATAGAINSADGYYDNGVAGIDSGGFSGGILTNASAFDASVVDIVEMYL